MHGDYHLANLFIAPEPPARVAAILDWENATIGDPLLDLATFLRLQVSGGRSHWGEREALIARWEEASGRRAPDLRYWTALSAYKLSIMLEGVYRRSAADPTRGDAAGSAILRCRSCAKPSRPFTGEVPMASVPPGCKLVLLPEDDYNHAPDAVAHYNESMYFSVFDAAQRSGGWYRLGNRVNEGHAEMSFCWYLPDGRVAFMASRPEITSNERMDAGGLRFEIVEPLERHRVTYQGRCVCSSARTRWPIRAARSARTRSCRRGSRSSTRAAGPCPGGELVKQDGTPLPLDPEKGFAKAHFDQMMHGEGAFEVDGVRIAVRGAGRARQELGTAPLAEHRLVPLDALLRVARVLVHGDGDRERERAARDGLPVRERRGRASSTAARSAPNGTSTAT
jgi:hypothetical protein